MDPWRTVHHYYLSRLDTMSALNKNKGWFAWGFAAAIIPFGAIIFDRKLKKKRLI